MINKLPLIEKIHLLESKLGKKWEHPIILEPFYFNSLDINKVQEASIKIAQHLGLPHLNFHIKYTKQKSNVAGNVNLDNSTNVFIEIDDNLKSDCDIVLAVLAHEICHKYLHLNNIKLFPDFENEMLTDAATAFTGLGKLSLNGCDKKNVFVAKSHDNTTTTISTQHKVGYMNRHQFAFVYCLVCAMRRIPETVMRKGLNDEASYEVNYVSALNDKLFDDSFFSDEFTLAVVSELLKNEIEDSQKDFAKFKRNVRIVQESAMISANQLYKEFHSYIKTKKETLLSSVNKSFDKEAHTFLKNVVAIEELKFIQCEILKKRNEMEKFGEHLSSFINNLNSNNHEQFSEQNLEFLFQFECPICNHKMRISKKKLARIKCPKCYYNFIVDTGVKEITITGTNKFTIINDTKESQNHTTNNNHKDTIIEVKKKIWAKIKFLFRLTSNFVKKSMQSTLLIKKNSSTKY